MSGVFALTEEVCEQIQQWLADYMTGDEIVTMLKHAYPAAFSGTGIEFGTAHQLDQLIFGVGAGGGYWREAYDYPQPDGIYIHDTDHGTEVYRCTSHGYFTFDKEVLLSMEMVAWVRAHHDTPDREGFCTRFLERFFPDGLVDFDALRWVDILTLGAGYDYSRAAHPGALGELQYRHADEYSESFFYRVTAAGYMTCTVERIPVHAVPPEIRAAVSSNE